MNFIRSNMSSIVLILIVLAIGGGYYWYTANAPTTSLVSDTTTSGTAGADLIAALNHLKSVTLDQSIFSSPTFQSLSDFGVAIPPQTLGRMNPFAPIAATSSSSGGVILPSSVTTVVPPVR